MSRVFIDHVSWALGERRRSAEEAAAAGDLVSDAAALVKAGFAWQHICGPGTTAYDLARRAIDPLRPSLGDIGAIVYATCLPINGSIGSHDEFARTRDVKHLMDFPASHLQADFGLDRAVVVGLSQQACTGMLGALHLARMLLLGEPATGRVLCVTADRFPPGALYEQGYNLISDGAAACIASTEPRGFALLAWHGITNGALARASDDETVGGYFAYTHRVIQGALAKAGLTMADIDWVVPQNTNLTAWKILSRLLGVAPERVYCESMAEAGHLISGDNLVNLARLDQSGRIERGDRLLLVMAGFGLNWQCVILEKA